MDNEKIIERIDKSLNYIRFVVAKIDSEKNRNTEHALSMIDDALDEVVAIAEEVEP